MSVWHYTDRPDKELRWYPKDAWNGWVPTGSPLHRTFDTMDGFDLTAFIAKVRETGSVASDYLLPPKSGDSWRSFRSRHGHIQFDEPWIAEHRLSDRMRARLRAKVTAEQESWEAARRQRQLLKQQASDAEWAEAQRKVDEAEAVLRARAAEERRQLEAERAAEQAALEAAELEQARVRLEALARREAAEKAKRSETAKRNAERAAETRARNQAAHEQAMADVRALMAAQRLREQHVASSPDREHWLSLFQHVISELKGTKYAVLIPEMERDMQVIVDAPPGPLPWRLDRGVFYRELAAKKAKVDQNG